MKNKYCAVLLGLAALSLGGGISSAKTVTLLHSFSFDSSKGKGHVSGVIADQQGALYGETYEGGANGYGTVFKLTPAHGQIPWKESVLYSFCSQANCEDGSYPTGGLVAYQGALFGVTTYGGHLCGESGCGTIFKLSPPASEGGPWKHAAIYRFKPFPSGCCEVVDGTNPTAGLIVDQQGVLYGTTNGGGLYGKGTVFKLPPDMGKGWLESVIHVFDGSDGAYPRGGLVIGPVGPGENALFGTTYEGGSNGYGTVFELLPPASGVLWPGHVLHSFAGGSDGAYPVASLVVSKDDGLFGTTTYGGANCDTTEDCGTVFRLDLLDNILATIHSFEYNGGDGQYPVAGVIFGPDGSLYGTTEYGGYSGQCELFQECGTIFKLTGGLGFPWTETVIHRFCDKGYKHFCFSGANPTAGLLAYQGVLYGTTSYQGDGATCNCGTVFKVTLPPQLKRPPRAPRGRDESIFRVPN